MERRVEACERRHPGQGRADCIQRRQRLGLVQRRELAQLAQRRLDLAVDPHRLAEALAAVDDAVTDGIGLAQP